LFDDDLFDDDFVEDFEDFDDDDDEEEEEEEEEDDAADDCISDIKGFLSRITFRKIVVVVVVSDEVKVNIINKLSMRV
jgi:hypothetical protein